MSLVLESDVRPVNKRMLLLGIADNANAKGLCKPGVEHLMGKTQIPRSTVFRLLKELEEEDGLLERRERRRKNGSRRSNAYRLNLEALAARKREVSQAEEDELEALFDDDEPAEDDADPQVEDMVPERDLAEDGAEDPQVEHMVPERDHVPARSHSGTTPVPERDVIHGPALGPLEPSGEPSEGGGGPESRQSSAPQAPEFAPPPPPDPASPPPPVVTFDLDDPDTWLCRKHAKNPIPLGEYRPPCGPCGGVRRAAQRQLDDRNRRRAEAEAAARRAEEEIARSCRARGWCDREGYVLERPGMRLQPQIRCEHDRDPVLIAAELRAAEDEAEDLNLAMPEHGPRSTPDHRAALRTGWQTLKNSGAPSDVAQTVAR
jgi:DNA-binding MarR family transcriptional regulator